MNTHCLRRCSALLLLLVGQSGWAAEPSPRNMEQLAADKGCYLCHRAEPGEAGTESLLPYAPSWVDIARKYRGQQGAEDRLTAIVLGGSDLNARHWRGKVSDAAMLPNVPQINEQEARQLVHWILSFRS